LRTKVSGTAKGAQEESLVNRKRKKSRFKKNDEKEKCPLIQLVIFK